MMMMITDIFENTGAGIHSSPFADDGATWKRGKMFHVRSTQKEIVSVEKMVI